MDKKQQILQLVSEYIQEKHANKTWIPGKDVVQYAGPYYSDEEYIMAINSLLNEWLILGKDAITFETEFPKLMEKKYGIVTNSGSSANLLMMSYLISKNGGKFNSKLYHSFGDKILVPVAGFPTTVNPIIQCGLEPIFCDIELDTLNISIYEIEKLLQKHSDIKAITFAHVLGNPPNIDKLMELVKKYNLILLEDNCDSLGSTYNNKPLGSFGELTSCSFFPAHIISCGEGGFVACNTKQQEKVIRNLRDWGRNCWCSSKEAGLSTKGMCGKRFSNWLPSLPDETFDHKYVYSEIGYNLKPIELQCSILLAQLKKLPEIIKKRKENYKILYNIFKSYEDFFTLPVATNKADVSWFAFPLTRKYSAPFKKHEFTMYLENNKIQTRNYFGGNLLLQEMYSNLGYSKEFALSFKNATYATINSFFLGTSPVITMQQYEYINDIVTKFFKTL